MVAAFAGMWLAFLYLGPVYVPVPAALLVLLWMIFRDPRRQIPAMPLGVVSPVDGRVTAVDLVDRGVVQGEAHRIFISIDMLGTYTARCPVEGVIKDLNTLAAEKVVDYRTNALWVQTDEGDDVILQFHGYRFGLAPSAFVRYGERIGQGQRCAYLRLTRVAEVHLPIAARVLVEPGQRLTAGLDVIGRLPSS
jgi:phosphatidylserine decarboxylase